LFSTIAYQLALNLPYLDDVMQVNPNLYTKSMVVQMCSLIIDSFWRLSSTIEYIPLLLEVITTAAASISNGFGIKEFEFEAVET